MQHVFNTPGQLDAQLEQLGRDRYHLFVNGRWMYAFYEASLLMDAWQEFNRQGYACTVVAAGEIFFYSRRKTHHTKEPPFVMILAAANATRTWI